jgi:tetratricopeptide (TPR) repeat protein
MLRGLLPSVPGSFRETLSAACDLAAGQYRRAALKAKGLQGEAPVACAPALEYVRAEGNRLRIAEVLDQPAPSQISLRELLDDTASGSLPRELLREPLDARAGSLVGFLTRENPEIEQGELVLRLLVEAFPEGFPDGSHLEAAWPRLRAAFGALVGERLARWELDVAPALAIVAQASRIDPAADLAPRRQFAGWRATLNEVVDDPARLLRFTQRFLELGWLPPGMQDLVATHCVAHGQKALGDDTPGAILASALVHLGEIAAGSAEEAGARAEGLVSKHAVLESLLGPRKDPAARRIRARFSRLCGVALAGAGDWERAGTWFEKADAFGYEPRFRLLRDQARVEKGRGQSGRVLVLAKARVKSLEAHAAAARTVTGAAGAVGFELRGYPLQPALIDPLRCEAHLDLAEALLAGDKAAEAGTACARATELDPRNPRNLLLSARIFQSQGKLNEARKAVFKGLRAVREETIRKQFRALLQELGPN